MPADLHVLAKSTPALPLNPIKYAAQAVPSLDEFRQLWSAWDLVTRHMISEEDLLSRPIDLRNCCLFYLGHIPTFLDIHLTRATGHGPTEPCQYHTIFERGIDPDVDDPEHCHAHSEIPDAWPPVSEILTYQDKVRSRVKALLAQEQGVLTKKIQRALWLGFEHEGMSTWTVDSQVVKLTCAAQLCILKRCSICFYNPIAPVLRQGQHRISRDWLKTVEKTRY